MKEQIIDTVSNLINRYGLRKFTVDEVASELHISKKTLYQYFSSKDEMICQYFDETLTSDRQSVEKTLSSDLPFSDKLHDIIHSSHKHRLPVFIMEETRQFYPEEWNKIKDLKDFKLQAFQTLLKQASENGLLRSDIHFGILSALLEKSSDLFLDTDFLLENGMKATQAIDEMLKIVMNGILSQK